MQRKIILAYVIGLFFIMTASVCAECTTDCGKKSEYDGFCYETKKGKVTIVGYSGAGGSLVIPDTIDGNPVTIIDSSAFYGCDSITDVEIGNNVEILKSSAFENCANLTSVVISDSVTDIKASVFEDCPVLAYVVIGVNVEIILNKAFCPNPALTTVFFTGDPPPKWAPESVFCPDTQMFTSCVPDDAVWVDALPPEYTVEVCETECELDTECPDQEVCVGFQCEEETLITLSSLEATWQDSVVAVRWFTETEIENSHFNLYRAESKKKSGRWHKKGLKRGRKKGPYIKINPVPIPAESEAFGGAAYEYVDTTVEKGRRYWYMLEDVDFYGVKAWHGACWPVSATEDCLYIP